MNKRLSINVAASLAACAVLLIFSITQVSAGEVTLKWDANDPAPDGYMLFQRTMAGTYDYAAPVWSGTETQRTLTVEDNVQLAFVVRAFVGNEQSGDSNEVIFTYEAPLPPVIIPGRPKTLTIEFQ